jgi:Ca2+-transporting ATPase
MKDALRLGVSDSILKAQNAGIKVVMITGDHKITAKSIAEEAGIYQKGDKIITGTEMDNMSDSEILKEINNVSVFARVNPEHKLRIVNLFRSQGKIIAMTGDGVNDAPSLVAADLGISMGKIGTEVAKEASDFILLDDNFETIVSAIEEGRGIYKSIKRYCHLFYQLDLQKSCYFSCIIA